MCTSSFDAGGSWQSLQRNLPVVPAQYMQVKDNDLVVATHGRGFWIMDNVTPLRQLTQEVTSAPAHLFDITPVNRYLPLNVRRAAGAGARRISSSAGENPSGGATIDYALKGPVGAVTLAILDDQGRLVQQFSNQGKENRLPAEPGMNRFVWDLRYPGAREVARPPAFVGAEFSRTQAPIAPPGRYSVRLSAGGRPLDKALEIQRDPRLTVTDADLRAQFELMIQIRDRVSEVTSLVDKVRAARQQLPDGQAGVADTAAAGIRQTLHSIESALTRLPGPNPNTFPPKGLNDRLGALSGAVAQADARPTRQMSAVFEELSASVAREQRRFDEVMKTVTRSRE